MNESDKEVNAMDYDFIKCDRCDAEADVSFFVRQGAGEERLSSALCYGCGAVSIDDMLAREWD